MNRTIKIINILDFNNSNMTIGTWKNNMVQKNWKKWMTREEINNAISNGKISQETIELVENTVDEINKINDEWTNILTKVNNGEIDVLEYYESLNKKRQEEERIKKKEKRKEKLKKIVNSISKFFKIKK